MTTTEKRESEKREVLRRAKARGVGAEEGSKTEAGRLLPYTGAIRFRASRNVFGTEMPHQKRKAWSYG